ncbi:hypothetical protein FRC07_000742 [Ceratobasidium sp. 392]|nr:hypothetical protein FRC07_000742 [Ceratobasidium sp. 392]
MPALEYVITRPYPWRWTTLTVCAAAVVVLLGLGVFNFAVVGYNQQVSYRDVFESSDDMGWRNKLNTGYTQNRSVNCNPNSLVVGGIYRTNNAIFALNTESLRDPITSAPLGSANYSGDVLDPCRVNRIYMVAEFATHDTKWRAQVACKAPNLFANFTVESIVTLRAGVPNGIVNVDTLGHIDNEQNRPEAIATAVLYALGIDVLSALFFSAPTVPSTTSTTNAFASAMWAEWDPLATDADLPIVVSGIAAPDGSYLLGPGADTFSRLLPTARRAIQNFAIGLHSAILLDLGSTVNLAAGRPDTNILTNITALQTRIQTSDLLSLFMTNTTGAANGVNMTIPAAPFLLSHTDDFRLPIAGRKLNDNGAGASTLVQRYLCHSMVLKPPATLVVDVIVATVSMFMVAWGIAQIGLMYFAKEHSENGNYCACPTCDSYAHRLVPPAAGDSHTLGDKDPQAVEYEWPSTARGPSPR